MSGSVRKFRTYPICLCPGIGRVDIITARLFKTDKHDMLDWMNYFNRIRTTLVKAGFYAEIIDPPCLRSVVERAQNMKRSIEDLMARLNVDKVHLICHSMGGLDARKMMYHSRNERFHRHIASITHIAVPHHGTMTVWWLLHCTPFGYPYRDALRQAHKEVGRGRTILRERPLPSVYGYVPDSKLRIPIPPTYTKDSSVLSRLAKKFSSPTLSLGTLDRPKREAKLKRVVFPSQQKEKLGRKRRHPTQSRAFIGHDEDFVLSRLEDGGNMSSDRDDLSSPPHDLESQFSSHSQSTNSSTSELSSFFEMDDDLVESMNFLTINSNTLPSNPFPPRMVRISSTQSSPQATPPHVFNSGPTPSPGKTNTSWDELPEKENTAEAALPFADLVAGVGNVAPLTECVEEIVLLREYYAQVDTAPDFRMLGIDINGLIDILPSQVEEFNTRAKYFELTCGVPQRTYCGVRERFGQHCVLRVLFGVLEQMERYDLVDQRVMWPMEESAPIIAENERRTQAGEWSEWETAEIKRITREKAAAMDNEEDKEEEQSEILAEDDIEGEQSEEEPSPAPTIHRALASRRNTSSPTQQPPQPQTPPHLPLSPLSTPVAPSPVPAFATTPSRAPAVMSFLPRTDSAFSDAVITVTTPLPSFHTLRQDPNSHTQTSEVLHSQPIPLTPHPHNILSPASPPIPSHFQFVIPDQTQPASPTSIPPSSSFPIFPSTFPQPPARTTPRRHRSHSNTPPSSPVASIPRLSPSHNPLPPSPMPPAFRNSSPICANLRQNGRRERDEWKRQTHPQIRTQPPSSQLFYPRSTDHSNSLHTLHSTTPVASTPPLIRKPATTNTTPIKPRQPTGAAASFLSSFSHYGSDQWTHYSFNDGMVSLKSQAWCDEFFTGEIWDADHLCELGWGTIEGSHSGRGRIREQKERMRRKWLGIAEGLAKEFPFEFSIQKKTRGKTSEPHTKQEIPEAAIPTVNQQSQVDEGEARVEEGVGNEIPDVH